MRRTFHLFLIPLIAATLLIFTPTHIALAATPCAVGSTSALASGGSVTVTAPAGHTYNFVYTGAATGSISVTGTLNIVNGTGGTLFYTIVDLNSDCPASFNPGDGRIDPHPNEHIVIYCNTGANPPTVDVWGVTNDTLGHRLYTFKYADLLKAGAAGIKKHVEPLGTVSAVVDANNNFVVRWFGGPAGGTGTNDFAKSFRCDFAK